MGKVTSQPARSSFNSDQPFTHSRNLHKTLGNRSPLETGPCNISPEWLCHFDGNHSHPFCFHIHPAKAQSGAGVNSNILHTAASGYFTKLTKLTVPYRMKGSTIRILRWLSHPPLLSKHYTKTFDGHKHTSESYANATFHQLIHQQTTHTSGRPWPWFECSRPRLFFFLILKLKNAPNRTRAGKPTASGTLRRTTKEGC